MGRTMEQIRSSTHPVYCYLATSFNVACPEKIKKLDI